MRFVLPIGGCALALACAGPAEVEDPCAWLDTELGAEGDTLVTLSPESTVALANAGRNPARIRVREGELALRADATGSYELVALKVVLSGFTIGELGVADHGLLVLGPMPLDEYGTAFDLTAASETRACASFDGELQNATRTELGVSRVVIDGAEQLLSLGLTYEAEFRFDEPPPIADLFVGASRVRLTGDLSASGQTPWVQR